MVVQSALRCQLRALACGQIAAHCEWIMTRHTVQILEQAIEGVGEADRAAVTEYIKNNTFETVIGPIRYENQNNDAFWTVGQWQNGVFYGVSSTGRPGAKPVEVKSGWQ